MSCGYTSLKPMAALRALKYRVADQRETATMSGRRAYRPSRRRGVASVSALATEAAVESVDGGAPRSTADGGWGGTFWDAIPAIFSTRLEPENKRCFLMGKVTLACQFCGKLNAIDIEQHSQGPKCAECAKPFLLDRPIKVSEENFDTTILKSEVPVIVDFFADWCAPCRMMAPILDDLAHEYAGELLVAKVDTDRSPRVGQRYNIKSIPFFARFENGEMVRQAVGAVGRDGLLELVE